MTNPHTKNLYAPPAAPMAAEAPAPGWAGFGFLRRVGILSNGAGIVLGPVIMLLMGASTSSATRLEWELFVVVGVVMLIYAFSALCLWRPRQMRWLRLLALLANLPLPLLGLVMGIGLSDTLNPRLADARSLSEMAVFALASFALLVPPLATWLAALAGIGSRRAAQAG